MSIRRGIPIVVALVSCAKSEKTAAESAEGTATSSKEEKEAKTIELPSLEAVPPLDLGPVGERKEKRARSLNAEGVKLLKGDDLAGAVDKFRAALGSDPGHLFARYHMASAYSRAGKPDSAIAILNAFNQSECGPCLNRLRRARNEKDLAALKDNPVFKELTHKVEERLPEPEDAAARVVVALKARDSKGMLGLVDPNGDVEVEEPDPACAPDQADCKPKKSKLEGRSELFSFVDQARNRWQEQRRKRQPVFPLRGGFACEKDCCKPEVAPPRGLRLEEICFQTAGKRAWAVSRIAFGTAR